MHENQEETLHATRDEVFSGPVFLHSSWRTSSTWLWQRFRQLPNTLCFYEPFHEMLPTISRQTASTFGADSWRSGHAQTAPYFFEYIPMIRRGRGVRLHQRPFSYDWFIPQGGLTGSMRRDEIRYVALLIRAARRTGRVPVLGFTRSLGRITPLKALFGGFNLFLLRNLWGQWMSVLDQRRKGGDSVFFYNVIRVIADQAEDRFLSDIHNFYFRRCVELAGKHGVLAQLANLPAAQFIRIVFDLLPEGEMFEMFVAVHLYLYLHASFTADFILDSTEMSRNPDYRHHCEAEVRQATGLAVDFSGSRQETLHVEMIKGTIDWQRIRQHARLAVAALEAHHDRAALDRLADRLISATIAEARI